MKFLLIILITIPNASYSQILEGVLGLTWRQDKSSVISFLKSKGGVIVPEKDPNKVSFIKINFGRYPIKLATLDFWQNHLYQVSMVYQPEYETQTIEDYNSICGSISSKYFRHTKEVEEYIYPYEKGDRHSITALSLDKLRLMREWEFHRAGGRFDYIHVKVLPDSKIFIMYTYYDLAKEAYIQKSTLEEDDY